MCKFWRPEVQLFLDRDGSVAGTTGSRSTPRTSSQARRPAGLARQCTEGMKAEDVQAVRYLQGYGQLTDREGSQPPAHGLSVPG